MVSGFLNTVAMGTVSGNRRATTTVDIMDSDDRPQSVEVVLDSGFTGYLRIDRPTGVAVGGSKDP